ncbi:hypothetical protein K501DRAFT_256088 [Backusella circina FSU 941]|nr:hypothetical protein K501DRAFT_256088 [Backusella circina FSU 941]
MDSSDSPHSLNSKKHITNYVLIPFALVQSEIYWLCSVLYYIFKHSLDALEEQQDLEDKKRRRANSAPTRSLSAPASPSLRRKSLPDINIRHRPSVHDERRGTTCPPLWWQKTRVKLGHTPVHGDPKPIVTTIISDSSSASIQSQESNTTNKQRNDTNPSTSSKKGSKFISKISARFHKRSRSRD